MPSQATSALLAKVKQAAAERREGLTQHSSSTATFMAGLTSPTDTRHPSPWTHTDDFDETEAYQGSLPATSESALTNGARRSRPPDFNEFGRAVKRQKTLLIESEAELDTFCVVRTLFLTSHHNTDSSPCTSPVILGCNTEAAHHAVLGPP
jgi:hypothetical protein